MTIFGPLVRRREVEQAVEDTVKLWLPSYLGQAGRDTDRQDGGDKPAIPDVLPESYLRRRDIATWAGDRLPVVITHCSRTTDVHRGADGYYTVSWAVEVGAVTSTKFEDDTWDLADIYAAEICRLLIQHSSLGGFATDVEWVGDSYPDDILPEKQRSLAGGVVSLIVTTDYARKRRAGPQGRPQDNPRDPYPDPPDATSHNQTFTPGP